MFSIKIENAHLDHFFRTLLSSPFGVPLVHNSVRPQLLSLHLSDSRCPELVSSTAVIAEMSSDTVISHPSFQSHCQVVAECGFLLHP